MKKLGLPASRLIALAAVAGVLAGGLAVYVMGGPPGNKLAVNRPQGPVDPACAATVERARTVAADATGDVAAMLRADPPQSLVALAFDDPAGKPMTLASLKDKVLLVNLWATWCAPCRAEMPALDALQKEMGGADFEVVAVNVDTGGDEKPKKFLEEIGVKNLAFYRDDTLGLFNELKRRSLALGLPVTLLVDRDGCLLAHMNGPAEWGGDDAKRLVSRALVQGS